MYGIKIPLDLDENGLEATEDCISVRTMAGVDGDTNITFGWFVEMSLPAGPPRYDGLLNTPDHHVDLFDANNPEIFTMKVPDTRTRVRIWTNHMV
jgi:hypothetical protein